MNIKLNSVLGRSNYKLYFYRRLPPYDLKKKFQIFFSTLLLVSISWQCGAKTVIYFNFKRQQKELAETVCENKDVVGSCCKAKCYLDKEIKKEEKRQSDFPSSVKDLSLIHISFR